VSTVREMGDDIDDRSIRGESGCSGGISHFSTDEIQAKLLSRAPGAECLFFACLRPGSDRRFRTVDHTSRQRAVRSVLASAIQDLHPSTQDGALREPTRRRIAASSAATGAKQSRNQSSDLHADSSILEHRPKKRKLAFGKN